MTPSDLVQAYPGNPLAARVVIALVLLDAATQHWEIALSECGDKGPVCEHVEVWITEAKDALRKEGDH